MAGHSTVLEYTYMYVYMCMYTVWLYIQESGEHNAVGFHMDTYDGCKLLWKDCIEYHAFFR